MATIGQVLTQPESGWKRIEETDVAFAYEGNWGSRSNSAYSGGSQKTQSNTVLKNKIKFKLYGTKIRIISSLYPTYTPKVKITINGKEDYYSLQGTQNNIVLVYEKTNLPLGLHYIEIEKMENGGYDSDFYWDAIDIDSTGYIADTNYSIKKLAIKSLTTDEHYSFSDNTLIHLPDNSHKNIILHGIEQGKEIQLDVPFDKHRYFNDSPVDNVSGQVFTHDIGKINTLSIKELVENKGFEPIYTWYNTNMTSDNAPVPYVAKSSGLFSTTYPAWKAFNGTTVNADDGWVSPNKTGWVEIYFGKKTLVNTLKLSHRNTTTLTSAPKNFAIEGSNDGAVYETICSINNEIDWYSAETRKFVFNNTKEYSYYRVNVSDNNGHATELSIGDILFGYKKEVK